MREVQEMITGKDEGRKGQMETDRRGWGKYKMVCIG